METDHSREFCDFCAAKYGAGIRKTVYLAAVWRASQLEGRPAHELAVRIGALQRKFAAFCRCKGVKAGENNPPLWKVAAEYFGGMRK